MKKKTAKKSAKKSSKKKAKSAGKVRTTNARTKRKLNIAEEKYKPIEKAILATLKKARAMSFSDLVKAVEKRVKEFQGSVAWYTISVLRDLESRGRVLSEQLKNRVFYTLK